jgi:hypothetical protein
MSEAPAEPGRRLREPSGSDVPKTAEPTVFVPAPAPEVVPSRRWLWFGLGFFTVVAVAAIGVLVAWPRLNPRRLDPAERVAEDYLKALAAEDAVAAGRLATLDEPPAIRSARNVRRDRSADRRVKGSFAPLAELHARIQAEYVYDPGSGRYTPKNPLGAAAETMDALQAAKEDAEKSGLYKKMQSGDPNDIFDAAEQFGLVFTKLAEGVLAPKRVLPSYQMLVESSQPPLPVQAKALALEFAASPKSWDALLKRPFQTLKADGPFIYERAEIIATVTDRLASLGDPPSRLRLTLVRFRLEGIDTGWKVISARRIIPGSDAGDSKPAGGPSPSRYDSPSRVIPQSPGSLHDPVSFQSNGAAD